MLNLLDPVQLEDLVLFRDDEDTRKFYLLPDQPVITTDDRGEPDFLFIRYIKDLQETPEGEDDGAGFLQFRTALVLDPVRRDRVVVALRERLVQEQAAGVTPFGRPVVVTEPLLAAPVWMDGTVRLTTFAVSDTGLVRKATESAPVDLTGDLGAMLALQLDDDGAEVFWSAFEGRGQHHVPISVQFDLSYKARVSARMEIHAKHEVLHREVVKWARPYQLLTTPFLRYVAMPGITDFVGGAALQALRASVSRPVALCVPRHRITETIRETISRNEITVTIETDQAATGEAGAKVQEALFGIATDVLTERVIPGMFGGGADRPGATDEGATSADQSLLEVREGAPPGDSRFDLVLDHSATIERWIHPNGPVQVLLGSDDVVARCFRTLRLSDRALSATQVVASTAGVDFERDGIAAVHVFFRYEHTDEPDPGRPVIVREHDGLLTAPQDTVRWRFDLARGADRRHKRDYLYKVDVLYRDGNRTESLWSRASARALQITPAAMGAIRVELVLTAPAGLVDGAEVDLRYPALTTGTAPSTAPAPVEATIELSPTSARQSWWQFTGEIAPDGRAVRPPTYSYRVRYRVRGAEVATAWRESSDPLLEIGTPFARLLTFTVRPQGSFEGVGSVSGDLDYRDDRYGYAVTESFELTDLADAHVATIGVLPGGPETVGWRARLTRTDGSGATLGPGASGPGTVWVGTDVDFLVIKVVPDLVDFEADVQLAVVELTYTDAANDIHQTTTMTFSKTALATQEWRVARSDRSQARYDASIRYVAYDRTTSSQVELPGIDDQVLLLERS
jgi:hypothetical protein